MATIRVRLDPKHEAVIKNLMNPNGSYGYRNTSEIVRLAIERLGHAQVDRLQRKDRDELLLEIANGIRKLILLIEGDENGTSTVELDRQGDGEDEK